ncbi:hypothetical protein DXG03_009724 [Asterophora parasitica]|uniref:Uncharacterized protein n=1 Tax=Asterophora parasitica TaxID=117018 RepID=A0A9P7G4J7_9AGAR|nr:hypothetical protein DXG03_009724 [Asterophora parasitica]
MSPFPHFWTRVVIFVDDPFPPPALLSSHLEWSRDKLIELTVTRRNPDAFVHDPQGERQRMKEIMGIIRPHIPRCETLSINVIHTSSLPRILTDFPDPAPDLMKLSLEVSAPGPFRGLLDNLSIVPEFQFPLLEELRIDGWNFVDFYRNANWWTEKLSESGYFFFLSVSHYRPTEGVHGEGPFEILSAYPLFQSISILALDDLAYSSPGKIAGDVVVDFIEDAIELETLRLSNLSKSLVAGLLLRSSFLAADFLTIDHCPLDVSTLNHDGGGFFEEVHLRNIDYPDTSQALQNMLKFWDGSKLTLENCPGFDDDILDRLGERHNYPPVVQLFASELHHLVLINCAGFSINALKRMVEARTAFFEEHDPDQTMLVTMLDGPEMVPDQRKWFIDTFGEKHLKRWDGVDGYRL